VVTVKHTGRRLTAYLGAGVLAVALTATLVQSGTVGAYDGLNKGVYVGDYGLELVGEPGLFHDDPDVWRMDPCAEEDSPGPCYWNANVQGNGVGRSFYVDSQQAIHYDPEGN